MKLEGQQERHFPATEKLDYDNYLVAIIEIDDQPFYKFTLRNGANCGKEESGETDWIHIQLS